VHRELIAITGALAVATLASAMGSHPALDRHAPLIIAQTGGEVGESDVAVVCYGATARNFSSNVTPT
jgi:hypothetical protein